MGSSMTAAKFWNNVVQDVQVAVGVKSGAQVEKERLATKVGLRKPAPSPEP